MYGLGIPVSKRDKKGSKEKKMHKKRVKRTEQKRKGWKGRGTRKEGRLRDYQESCLRDGNN